MDHNTKTAVGKFKALSDNHLPGYFYPQELEQIVCQIAQDRITAEINEAGVEILSHGQIG
jgi:hypothetical protein